MPIPTPSPFIDKLNKFQEAKEKLDHLLSDTYKNINPEKTLDRKKDPDTYYKFQEEFKISPTKPQKQALDEERIALDNIKKSKEQLSFNDLQSIGDSPAAVTKAVNNANAAAYQQYMNDVDLIKSEYHSKNDENKATHLKEYESYETELKALDELEARNPCGDSSHIIDRQELLDKMYDCVGREGLEQIKIYEEYNGKDGKISAAWDKYSAAFNYNTERLKEFDVFKESGMAPLPSKTVTNNITTPAASETLAASETPAVPGDQTQGPK